MRAPTVRVLHVFGELKPSGGEEMMRVAAGLWARHRVEATVLAVGPTPGPFAPALAEAGYPVRWLPAAPRRALLGGFRSLLRRDPVDVVHLHAERADFWLALTARSAGAAVVRTVHSTFRFTGALRLERTAQRALLRHIGVAYVAVSPSVRDHELAVFGNATTVVDSWFDRHRFVPPAPTVRARLRASLGVDPGASVITSVGNCSPIKNHGLLLDALARLAGPWVHLHVGDPSRAPGEEAQARRLGLADRVRFLGPRDDVAELLCASDVFVMPSLHEGLGLAAVEAMACGVPIVLTDVPGLRDVAPGSSFARLVPLAPGALAAAMSEVLSWDGATRAEAAGELRVAASRFDPAVGVARYAERYRTVARRGRSG